MSPQRIKLSQQQIVEKIKDFPDWSPLDNSLVFNKTFRNFSDAFCFITKVALVTETLNHHATIVNTYDSVSLTLSTHDAGGVTEMDFQWITLLNS